MVSPATLLGLSKNWKYQGPTGAGDVFMPRLQNYSDKNFRVSGDRVIFTASVGGKTTSNSSYPRSEMREMVSNGQKQAAWSNRSGTHIMTLDQAFLHLPERKPHVVAGQIHGGDDDITVCRLEGKKLYITDGDKPRSGHPWHLIDSNYVLGTRFTITFDARPGGIDFDYNSGAATGTVPGNYSGCYFKFGCYTQANRSNGSGYGQVAVWDVTMGPLPPKPARPAKPVAPPPDNPCGG